MARESDVVLIAVVNADQARDVLTGSGALLDSAKPGLIVVLLSTVSVDVIHELANVCADAGATLLDCGVTNGDRAREHGIVAMVGGADEASPQHDRCSTTSPRRSCTAAQSDRG